MEIEQKLTIIKEWLGTGSINIFGLPMSGKDTQGVKLAEALDAKFLSSGMIVRAMETETKQKLSDKGNLIPTNIFYEWVLPYFERRDLFSYPLILSSIGRWSGEEDQVMSVAAGAGHEIKAAVILNISEADVENRFKESKVLNDRGERADDKDLEIFHNRLQEFRTKTLPVLQHYQTLGLLVEVNGDQTREAVFNELVEKLYAKAAQSRA
ncbi:MAG: nucleoside monophosphate kinase [Candidatus Saccharibacteria bacterium]|uniref:Adenylate kinase n=1 Tax=Candidatus Nanosyncoccus alces TaxID=2171997 RepID=A0ABY0FLV5_9BACT|nr:nucleoside monophosphate kinase [Candidatus Nanosyncoccus alces]MDO4399288.1 nucleoside monophosphate kinase [Candidatus Saccharibacteria bacterium]RYC74806.1 adenylate kinase [Candidatus Nanosyncoccus alces]